MGEQSGAIDTLRDQLANAPELDGPAGDQPRDDQQDAPSPTPGGGGGRAQSGRRRGEIFDGCPVKPLGIHGELSFYLDVRGQLRAIDNHSLDKIRHVFGGRVGILARQFPQIDKDGKAKAGRFDQNNAAFAMVAACEEKGVWSPTGRVRGAGSWVDDDGALIYHAGDQILMDGEWHEPGVYDGKVYSAADRIPRPATTAGAGDAVAQILDTIETWFWRRPDVDPILALGAIGAQMLGGALDWRPVTWLTGDQATGKSTFQKFLKNVHGGSDGLLQASDATEAGIRSVIGYSALPVAIDELEPDDDPRNKKAANIIKLARIAASGDQILRGSTDQKGYQGNAYSCFIFSSILVPPLPPQDRSRLIMLDLNEIPKEARRVDPDWRKIRKLGAHMRRLLIEGWTSWPARLDAWRSGLAAAGYGGRHADNYGTVLAMADMALNSELPTAEVIDNWVAKLAIYLADDTAEVGSNAQDMLTHLMGQMLDPFRKGKKYTLASWVAMVGQIDGAAQQIDGIEPRDANKVLADYGLRVSGKGRDAVLAIANTPINQLGYLFADSRWASGVWKQAAQRVPGATRSHSSLRFSGNGARATLIPFKSIPSLLDLEDTRPVATPAAPVPPSMDDYA